MAVSVHQQCWSWWRGEDSARPVTRPVSRQPQWCDAVLRGLEYGLLRMLAVSPRRWPRRSGNASAGTRGGIRRDGSQARGAPGWWSVLSAAGRSFSAGDDLTGARRRQRATWSVTARSARDGHDAPRSAAVGAPRRDDELDHLGAGQALVAQIHGHCLTGASRPAAKGAGPGRSRPLWASAACPRGSP